MAIETDEHLIGFDIRIVNPALWPDSRRDSYLLRPDAKVLLSVDTSVAESRFAFGDDPVDVSLGQVSAPGTGWHRTALRLWDDLAEMQAHWGKVGRNAPHISICIAITAADRMVISSDIRWVEATKEAVVPRTLDSGWTLLGYDLADRFFLSGLSNCGSEPQEYALLRPQYGPRVNDFGLFTRLDDAATFLSRLDQLASEHAPFFPFGVWTQENPFVEILGVNP